MVSEVIEVPENLEDAKRWPRWIETYAALCHRGTVHTTQRYEQDSGEETRPTEIEDHPFSASCSFQSQENIDTW